MSDQSADGAISSQSTGVAAPPAPLPRGRLVLWTLTFVYVINFLDRSLLGILAKPIQDSLHVTDGQLGLIGGLYFAVFYCFIAIPVGWLADRTSRVGVLSSLQGTIVVLTDRQFRRFHIFGRFWRPDWPRFRRLFKLGSPIGLTMGFEGAVFSAAAYLMGLFGAPSVAAHQIALQTAATIQKRRPRVMKDRMTKRKKS